MRGRPGWFPLGRGMVAGVVGLAACVALAGGLLLVIAARNSPSSVASSRPSTIPTVSPAASPRPIASPTPGPTATVVEATLVARVADCQNPLGWDYAVSGNDLFVVCAASDSQNPKAGSEGPYVARVDLTTNKVTATYRYKATMTYIEKMTVDSGILWFEAIVGGSGCVGDCHGWRRLEGFDVATRKNTVEIPDVELVGSSDGYIWVRDSLAENGPLRKLDPKTGKEKGRIPLNVDAAQVACGSLWGITANNEGTDNPSTTVARIEPSDGRVLASFSVPGLLSSLQSVGSECWGSVKPGASDPYTAYYADHFIRIGDSGVEYTSPLFYPNSRLGPLTETYVDIQAGSFWLVMDDRLTRATLQRLDPSTWQPTGTPWRSGASGYQGDPFAIIGGSVWVFDDAGGISRLAIPLG